MTLREAMDAFEMAARAEIILKLRATPADIVKIEEGLAEARSVVVRIIGAIRGQEAQIAWESAQDKDIVG